MTYKSIIVKDSVVELNSLLNEGWVLVHAFNHPKGGILVLKKT